jgi:gamma-tubulin complex component 2
MIQHRFYKSIEDGYTYANRTLLKLLMEDQALIPRLRSLKHYFFLSQSSFLTHFMDLSASELRKPAKGVSIVKLQSLLDLALNSGESFGYREDVKITMASSGLYEWLLKVVSVSGAIGGEGEDFAAVGAASVGAVSNADVDETGKDKDKDKKQLQGMCLLDVQGAS